MRYAERARVVALASAFGLAVTSCAKEVPHAPFISATCRVPPCSAGAVISSSPGTGEADSGASTTDSVAAGAFTCRTDPTSLVELCTGSVACPGLLIDPVAFAGCGFRGTGVDVECVCNGNSLCPVAVQTNCSYVATQLSLKTFDQICAPALTGGCVDVNNLPRATGGAGGAGGVAGFGVGGGP